MRHDRPYWQLCGTIGPYRLPFMPHGPYRLVCGPNARPRTAGGPVSAYARCMPRRHIRVTGAAEAPLRAALRALRTELEVPESFPADVLAEAERAAGAPRLPSYDATDVPLFTIDPPTSTDLDQAMHLSRRPGGYRVRYA
ncbi:MAG: hypothetical protein QOC85_3587, partial [Streptomyces sp.]|nr:hypothetical protein [Streptomyces sp.]